MTVVLFAQGGVPNATAIQAGLVTGISSVPAPLLTPGIPAQCYVDTAAGGAGETRQVVDGTLAAITAIVNANGGGGGGGGGFAVAGAVFVAPAPIGNDATGTRGNPALPFATLSAAFAAALAGDQVILQAGTYAPAAPPVGLELVIEGAGVGVSVLSGPVPAYAPTVRHTWRRLTLDALTVTGAGPGSELVIEDVAAAGSVSASAIVFGALRLACSSIVATDAETTLLDCTTDVLAVTNTDPASSVQCRLVSTTVTSQLSTSGVAPRVTVDPGCFVQQWTASTLSHSTAAPVLLVHAGQVPVESGARIDWSLPADTVTSVGTYQIAATWIETVGPLPAPLPGVRLVFSALGASPPIVYLSGTQPIAYDLVLEAPNVNAGQVFVANGTNPNVTTTTFPVPIGTRAAFALDNGSSVLAPGANVIPLPFLTTGTGYGVVLTPIGAAPALPPFVSSRSAEEVEITNPNAAPANYIVSVIL